MIKCANGWNHYGLRNVLINGMTNECPRCSRVETQDHVIRCDDTREFRKQFIIDLLSDLMKNKSQEVSYNDVFDMMEDILRYLDGEEIEEYETNQEMIGIVSLFRGYAVKVQKDVDFSSRKYHCLNKILIEHCVSYYKKCLDHRNKVLHDEGK